MMMQFSFLVILMVLLLQDFFPPWSFPSPKKWREVALMDFFGISDRPEPSSETLVVLYGSAWKRPRCVDVPICFPFFMTRVTKWEFTDTL